MHLVLLVVVNTKPILDPAIYLPLVGGVLIPFLVALLTKYHASGWLKGVVAFVVTGLTALGVYVADIGQSHTWHGALTAFLLAAVGAVVSRTAYTGGLDTKLALKTANFGIGYSVDKRAELAAKKAA